MEYLSQKLRAVVLIMLFFSVMIQAQESIPMTTMSRARTSQENISGTVKDILGTPVIGASITLRGEARSTSTDMNGKFVISVPDSNAVLIVSYLGYETKDVRVGKNISLSIVMNESTKELEQVVITGLFTRNADSYTGSVLSIKKEDLLKVGNSNILASIKNIDPSFQIVESNQFGSDPNQLPDIQIRGSSSFSDMKDKYQTSPNQPLFIINGFEQSLTKVLDLDMNMISSVTILKDATAKAIYGSKGANGVVVIETEQPKQGRLLVSYKADLNIQYADLTSYNLANAKEKLEIERLSGVYTSDNALTQQSYDEQYAMLWKEVQRGVNTYWLDKPLQIGIGQKHSGRVEGGTENVRYSLDLSYNDVQGVMKGSDRKTLSGSALLSYRYKTLLFRNTLSVTNTNSANSPYGVFSEYSKLNSYWRPFNEDGSVNDILGSYAIANKQGFKNIYNPLINASLNTKEISGYLDVTNNFYIEWNAFKDLRLIGQVGITTKKSNDETYLPRNHTSFRDIAIGSDQYFLRGSYSMTNGSFNLIDAVLKANYSKELGKHVLFANSQFSLSENNSSDVTLKAQGFASDNMDYITQALQYAESGKPSGNESLTREIGLLGAVNYSYDERYLLDYSYRLSASSLFGADNRWGNFWALGVGWNAHKESFFKGISAINQLRVRLSTGFSGSQNFKTYQALATYKYNSNVIYDNIIGSYLLSMSNPDLKWQRTRDNNLGIDMSFLESLNINVDIYQKITENLLTPVSVPSSTGFSSYVENLGKTQNTGIETRANLRIIKDKKSQTYFSVFASLAHNKNKLLKISDALTSLNDDKDDDKVPNSNHEIGKESTIRPSVRYQEGQSMSAIWAVRSLGIDPMTGNEIFLKKDGTQTYDWNSDDQVVCGDALQKVSGTFGFNLEYKGFSINTSCFYRLGGQYYNNTLVEKVENADVQYNVDNRMYTDRWTTPGVAAKFKKFNKSATFTRPTSRFIQDFNEMQLTSLNIGYNFRNHKLLKKWNIQQLKITAYSNDILRVSTVKAERGLDYPFSRSISGSVQITF